MGVPDGSAVALLMTVSSAADAGCVANERLQRVTWFVSWLVGSRVIGVAPPSKVWFLIATTVQSREPPTPQGTDARMFTVAVS